MARESIEERRARLMPGARWLRAQREQRGWSGSELAARLGISQERVSAYERAQDEPPTQVARKIAEAFGMPEIQVWRCLGLALPVELQSDEAVIEWARRRYPRIMARVPEIDGQAPGKRTRRDRKRADVTHTGESVTRDSHGEESAV